MEIKPEWLKKLEAPPPHKKRFLEWLDRFAFIEDFKREIAFLTFSEEELLKMKPQIEQRYRLKKSFERRMGREA